MLSFINEMDSKKELAEDLYEQEDYEGAKQAYKELAELQKVDGDYRGYIESQIYLSHCFSIAGLVDETIERLEDGLDETEKQIGDDDSLIGLYLEIKHNLANCLFKKSRHEVALGMFQDIAKIDERLGVRPSDALATQNSIALCLSELGRIEEARDIHEKIVEMQLEIYGPDHPRISTVKNNLAASIMDMGDYDKALPILEGITKDLIRCGKEKTMEIIKIKITMVNCLHKGGHLRKALELCIEVEKLLREKFQNINPEILTNQRKMIDIQSSLEMHDEALKAAKENVKLHEQFYQSNDPAMLRPLLTLANCEGNKKNYAKAYQILKDAEEKFKDTATRKTLASVHEQMGNLLYMLERYDEAMNMLIIAESELEILFGAEHKRVRDIFDAKEVVTRKQCLQKLKE